MHDNFQIAQLFVEGGIGLAIIKAVWYMGQTFGHINERLSKLENDIAWIRAIVGTRKRDSEEKSDV